MIAGMNGSQKVECSSTMRQMYRDKKKFSEHTQINNLLRRIEREVPRLKRRGEGVKVLEKKMQIAGRVPLSQQLKKGLAVLTRARVQQHRHPLMILDLSLRVKKEGC